MDVSPNVGDSLRVVAAWAATEEAMKAWLVVRGRLEVLNLPLTGSRKAWVEEVKAVLSVFSRW